MKCPDRFVQAPPVSPGDILRERILDELDLTQDQLADAMQVSRLSINQIVNGRRAITAEMAVKLGYVTSTTPEFWLNLQRNVDLYSAQKKLLSSLSHLKIVRKPKRDSELIADVTDG